MANDLIPTEDELFRLAQEALTAAAEFRKACAKRGMTSAVRWIEGTDGMLIVFTRGEYSGDLKEMIKSLGNNQGPTYFMHLPEKE